MITRHEFTGRFHPRPAADFLEMMPEPGDITPENLSNAWSQPPTCGCATPCYRAELGSGATRSTVGSS